MSDFKTQTESGKLDPNKRVKYSTGLVLGVDEFEQEQFFFLEQGRRHQRGLHGSGVVCGLDVSWDEDAKQINVSPGMAVDLHGRVIQVEQTQCADLKPNQGKQPLYILLCYRECESDSVPVPGAPCRTEDENFAASRITSSFELRFSDTPPNSDFESAVRDFGDELARFQVSASQAKERDLGEIEKELKKRYEKWSPTKVEKGQEANVKDIIWIAPDQFEELMRRLLALWVHQIKPDLALSGKQCRVDANLDGCIALAVLSREGTELKVDYQDTPILLSSRMNQEYLLSRDVTAQWHSDLLGLENKADHPQYLTLDGHRPMQGNLQMDGHDIDMGGAKVTRLDKAENNGEAMPYGQDAEGDLSGNYPAPTVRAIQGVAVTAKQAPVSNDILVYHGGANPRFELRKLNLGQLGDVITTGAAPGYMLIKQADGWKAMAQPGPVGPAGGDLRGDYPNPVVTGIYERPIEAEGRISVGSVLALNETLGAWQVRQLDIDELADVEIGAKGEGSVLMWNGDAWSSQFLPPSDASGMASGDLLGEYPNPTVQGIGGIPLAVPLMASMNEVLVLDGTNPGSPVWQSRCLTLNDLCDVEVPYYDSEGAMPGMPPGADPASMAGMPPDTDPASMAMEEQVLVYSGGKWRTRPASSMGAGMAPGTDPGMAPGTDPNMPPGTDPGIAPGTGGEMNGPASGDLLGNYPSPSVAKLRGRGVSNQKPKSSDVLTWDGEQWRPHALRTLNLVEITLLNDDVEQIEVELWFHLQVSGVGARVEGLTEGELSIEAEFWKEGQAALRPIPFEVVTKELGNVVQLMINIDPEIRKSGARLHFKFDSERLMVFADDKNLSLLSYGRREGLRFEGEDASTGTVTSFLRIPGKF